MRAGRIARSGPRDGSLPGPVSEEYLQARALLSSFMMRTGSRADLDRAHALFTSVTDEGSGICAGWSGLGIAELQYARHGFGGQIHVMRARRAFDEALKLDPASTEANLYRIYMLLSRGEKESARHGIANLLTGAANDWNVHMVAGMALRGDGMYDEALSEFNRALKLNPANAAILYNHRARVYHYQNQLELAGDELEKGLALEPRHPLLRTSSGYQQMRLGNLGAAIEILEGVIRDDEFAAHRGAYAGLVLRAGGRSRAGGGAAEGRYADGGRGRQRDGLPAGYLLRGGRRLERGAALAAARDLSGQRKLSVVPEESGVE